MSEKTENTLEERYSKAVGKLQVGDYQTAAKMLNISVDNVKARFRRLKENAINAIEEIIENRESMIADYSKEVSTNSEK